MYVVHPWVSAHLAEDKLANARRHAAPRRQWIGLSDRRTAGVRVSAWTGYRLIAIGCRLARRDLALAAHAGA